MVPHLAVFVDRVPAGEVEVRRHEQVHTADNAIARVEGLVVDDADHITHVLLQEGHLWGRVLITLEDLILVSPSHRTLDSGQRLYEWEVFHDAQIETELPRLRRRPL